MISSKSILNRKNVLLFRCSFFLIFLLFFGVQSSAAFAQQNERGINGRVTDVSGEPMIGVTVLVKNTTSGTITDINGTYSIKVSANTDVLTFSYIGFTAIEQTVGNRTTINVILEEDDKLLDEVVVVGYGTMKKRDISGAISQVEAEKILSGNPAASINQALQGRLAGVAVTSDDGSPGGGINIQVRGVNSFSTDSQPLYIVDGIPFIPPTAPQSAENRDNSVESNANALSFINPHDIASIEVLKDASATAIYGSRGANGVIIITTKQGEKGKPRIEFTSNFGTSTVRKKVEVLDAYHYALYRNEQQDNGFIYDGGAPVNQYTYPDGGLWKFTSSGGNIVGAEYTPSPQDFLNPGWYYGTDPNGGEWNQWVEGTNWQDQIFRTAYSQEYNFQISGANDRGNHSFSGNYISQEGIIRNTGFDRYTLRANIGQKLTNYLTAGLNMNYSNSLTDFAKGNSLDYSILRSALLYPSTIYHDDYSQSDDLLWLSPNPKTYVESAKNELASSNIFASAYLLVDIGRNLTFRQNIGLNNFFNERSTYYNRDTGEGRKGTTNGRGGWSTNKRSHTTLESILTFNKTFNKIHNINAMAAVTTERSVYSELAMSATQFPTDITENYDMGGALLPDPLKSNRIRSSLFSMLGRVNYVINEKYILTTSFRRDGSSKFSVNNRFANFASGAFAWRASEEHFIKNLNLFDNLKFRLSFGQTGNQAISDYQTTYTLYVANYPFGGSENSGYTGEKVYNSNLKWETTDQYNAGIDFGFMKNRLSFTIDYYYKKTKDLLQSIKISQSSGYTTGFVNMGAVSNEGLELTGSYNILNRGHFNWSVDGNLSFNRNIIHDLPADQYSTRLWYRADNVFIQRNGYPIGAMYGYVEDGFYDNEAEVRANPIYANAEDATVKSMIGEIKYRDIDGKEGITASDMTIIGNTNPDYTFGVTNNFSWKKVTFSFFVQGVQGNDIFNGNLMNVTLYNTVNIPTFVNEGLWTSENRETATWPKATNQQKRTWLLSDRYIEDGSYIRLKNVNVGYTFDKPKFAKGINSINLNLSASNLLTISNYSWYDPDVNAFGSDPSRRGVDIYSYPASRTFSLGLKIQF